MGTFRHALFLIVAFVLQTTWIHLFEISALQPDLVILVLVYIGITAGRTEATILGFVIGFFQDTYMPADLGLNAMTNSIIGFAVGYGRLRIMADDIQVQLALVFGAVLIHDLIFYLGYSGVALADVPLFWIRYGLGRAFYTALLALFVAFGLILRKRFLPV